MNLNESEFAEAPLQKLGNELFSGLQVAKTLGLHCFASAVLSSGALASKARTALHYVLAKESIDCALVGAKEESHVALLAEFQRRINQGEDMSVLAPQSPPSPPFKARTLANDQEQIVGYVDRLNFAEIGGWVIDVEVPDQPVEVEILINSSVIATVVANEPRHDLLGAGFDNCMYGFTFRWPDQNKPIEVSSLSVRVRGCEVSLE